MYESRPGIELYYFYDSYGNLTSIRYLEEGATTEYSYYVTTNIQGDVLGIYTSQGIQVAAYEYDAWGNRKIYSVSQVDGENVFTEVTYAQAVALCPALNNPFGYRGYYYDQDMGLYYLQSRYYDPQIGRFINADDQFDMYAELLGYNLFAYCANNPIQYKDTSGESITLGAIIGSVAISFFSVYVCDIIDDASDGKSISEILTPNMSSVGTYVGSIVSGLIPGASVKMAFCRIVVNLGLKYGIDVGIRKDEITVKQVAVDLVLELFGESFGLIADKLNKLVRPKNYSSFKHDISMYLPNITKSETEMAMKIYGKTVTYVFETYVTIIKIFLGIAGNEVNKVG